MGIARFKLIIHGTVQGVGYRYSAKRRADELTLTGWVKNRHDGSVEILAEGSETALNAMMQWAEQGPLHAKVSTVECERLTTNGEFKHFDIR